MSVLCILLDLPGCSSILQTNVYVELHLHSHTWLYSLHTDCTKRLQVGTGSEYWKGNSKCNMLGAANHVVLLQVVGLDWFWNEQDCRLTVLWYSQHLRFACSVCRQINNTSYFIKFEASVLAAKLQYIYTYIHAYIHKYINMEYKGYWCVIL